MPAGRICLMFNQHKQFRRPDGHMAIPNILDEDHTDAAAQLLRTYYRRTAAGPAAAAGSPGHGCISLTLGPP
jgi:hypothetical protein